MNKSRLILLKQFYVVNLLKLWACLKNTFTRSHQVYRNINCQIECKFDSRIHTCTILCYICTHDATLSRKIIWKMSTDTSMHVVTPIEENNIFIKSYKAKKANKPLKNKFKYGSG